MPTSEHLLWSPETTRRSTFVTHLPTDHDAAAHRHTVDLDATVRISGGELRACSSRLVGLSLGGAVIDVDRLPVGTLINLTFRVPAADDRLSLDAVVQSTSRDGVSVLFDSPRAWEVWVLWRYLVSLDVESLDDEVDLEPTRTRVVGKPAVEP